MTHRIEEYAPSRIWLVRSFLRPQCHRKRDRSLKIQSRREIQMFHRGDGPSRRDVVRHPLGDEDDTACLDTRAIGIRPLRPSAEYLCVEGGQQRRIGSIQ